ncbi:MAG: carboxypeptidase regulatory-like domain-containing protein [Bacteroidales bacterium]|nr:carboxypeptidase regulatory-like domain-containing protein [Bacteroidales bacterium]
MKKTLTLLTVLLLTTFAALAQTMPTGGVKGTVVNRQGRIPIAGAEITLLQKGVTIETCTTAQDGTFLIEGLADGIYDMIVNAEEFIQSRVFVTVDKGFIKDMFFISMTAERVVTITDEDVVSDLDMADASYADNPTIMFDANDVFSSVAGYGFSSVRFKNRGYNSESNDVLLAGIKLNDAITGYSPYSLWSGLNEAMRAKETTLGLDPHFTSLGRYNGVTNILATPYNVRKGWRFSALSNSALYRLRLMAAYSSGEMDNGISYAFNVSARLGGNDWVKGVYYRSFSYYAGISKNFDDVHRLSLVTFAAPGERGAQNASTQEVYDLMGDNMYNSNWGYQAGKMRNSRVRRTFEPVTLLEHVYTPNDSFESGITILWRTGKNGYSALDWYDAPDPRPDYYRNLPSYAYMEDDDYGRLNREKYDWAYEMWSQHGAPYNKYQHIDWDHLYEVNRISPGGRSKYTVEERHVDHNDINIAAHFYKRFSNRYMLRSGVFGRYDKARNYKKMKDLLGGDHFLNMDQFAERDHASSEAMAQNDLDYFLANGEAQKIRQGDLYGYNYNAVVRYTFLWIDNDFDFGRFKLNFGLSQGYNSLWREGLYRKGLFAGLDDNGKEIVYKGEVLTRYDAQGNPVTSKGMSEIQHFYTFAFKTNASYIIGSNHRIAANVGYFSDAPTFNQTFISARTRNTINPNLTNMRTFTSDITYQYNGNGVNARVTAFHTQIMDKCDVTSFYDDSQKSYTNFAMSEISQRHIGVEAGIRVPLFIQGLTASAVLSYGDYIYNSTPMVTQTIDNSAELVIDNQPVKYWQSHPIYKQEKMDDGSIYYPVDSDGNYIVEKTVQHYVEGTPQIAAALALNYRTNSYWFFEVNAQYFDKSYLDMNPLYRTEMACAGPDGIITPQEITYMASQIRLPAQFLLNASVGKSWYIKRTYNIGFSLELKNILNNRDVITGGYEQTRLITSDNYDRYYKFDPKYFYMSGFNYMLNIYFRF